MAKRCLVEACKREAETYCYHCSHDVCTKHYLEHQKSIQEQLHPLVDEINLLYDRLRHDDKTSVPQYLINAYSQLDRWRDECYHRINTVYDRVRHQIEGIAESHKHDEAQKVVRNLRFLQKMQEQLKDLLREGDVTLRQLEAMKQQLEELKKKEQELVRDPNIRIMTQKIDVDKHVSVTTDIKQSNEKQQQARPTKKMPPTKVPSVQHRPSRWSSSSGKTAEKCPMCSKVFSLSMTMTDRTVHINEHLPD